MLSLSSFHRAQRGSARRDSDNEALASGSSGINMDSMGEGAPHSGLYPATTTVTRVTGGSPYTNGVHSLPDGQIGVQNGIVFEEVEEGRLHEP